VVVMVMTVMMVVFSRSECRAGTHQDQNGGDDELLHAMQSSTLSIQRKYRERCKNQVR